VCYVFYYVDKTTLSYAAIFGIEKDLKLAKTEYKYVPLVLRPTAAPIQQRA
jgi:hypothetical protein